MRKTILLAIFLLVVIAFALLIYGGALTYEVTFPLSKEFFSTETSPTGERPLDLKGVMLAKSQGDDQPFSAQAAKELDRIYQQQLDKGIRNLPFLSAALLQGARKARERRDVGEAVTLAGYAIKFSPDLYYSYFELARTYWQQNPFQIDKILGEAFRGERARFRSYPTSLRFFYNLFFILSNATLIAFMIFGIIIMARYLPLYFYDIRKNLTQEFSALLINSIKVLVLLVPFILRLDILWAVLYWCILLWGYVANRERTFVVASFILLVYLSFSLKSSSFFLDGASSDIILDVHQANSEEWDGTLGQKLEVWLSTHPDDAEVLFTLGLIKKREARLPQAEQFYQKAIQQAPQFSQAFSNLGNVYFIQKQIPSALAAYQQAIRLDSDKGAYYFNLSRAYSQANPLSAEINKAFDKARRLDSKLVDQFATMDLSNPSRMVIDEVLTAPQLWRRFFTEWIGREGILFRLFKAWFERIPSRIPFLAPILFLLFLIAMSRATRSKKFLTRCPMCGSPTYRFYLGSSEEEFICFNCHRIFVQKEKIHATLADRKLVQVRQFQKQNQWISKFLSIFFVGFGDLWRGQSMKGILSLIIFFVFVLRFLYWEGVLTPFLSQPSSNVWRWVIWGGLFVVFYLFSLRRVFRFKPKFGTEK